MPSSHHSSLPVPNLHFTRAFALTQPCLSLYAPHPGRISQWRCPHPGSIRLGCFRFYICSSTNIWFSVNPRSRMPCIGSGIYCFPTSSHLRNHPTFSLFLSPLDRTACFLVTICPRGGELLVLLDFSSSSLGVIPQFRGVAAHPLPKPLPTYAPAFHMLPSSGFLLRSHFRPGNIHPFARCLITERELKAAAQLRSRGRTTRPPDRA